MQDILIQPNSKARQGTRHPAFTSDFDERASARARRFHQTVPGYQPTPLHTLTALGADLNLDALWLKDESQRFNLNAFKGLGASYAVARLVAEQLGLAGEDLDFAQLATASAREQLKDVVFASATAEAHDAEVTVTDVNYDDSVRLITERAGDNGWLLVQDTVWAGYEEIPLTISLGEGSQGFFL